MNRICSWMLVAAMAPAMGCVVADASDSEQLGSKAQAVTSYHRMHATDHNTNILRHGCYDGNSPARLKWKCTDGSTADNSTDLDGHNLLPRNGCKHEISANDTEIGEPVGDGCSYTGQCVAFVKGMARAGDVWPTSYWNKGAFVVESGTADMGDVIATFDSNGNYYGHVGIFMSYIRNDAGAIIGFNMADQNWDSQSGMYSDSWVTKHAFYRSGSGNSDADRYSFVRVPD